MKHYQLRLPDHYDLARWVDEMNWFLWDELLRRTPFEKLAPHAFVRIRELLEEVLAKHVTAYRSCGLWSFCQAPAAPSPWMPPQAYWPDATKVQWFILEVQEGLEELVAETTDRISKFLFNLLGGSLPRGVIEPTIEAALQRGIGRYLYENPNCRTHPLCHASILYDPWQPTGEDQSHVPLAM